MEKSENHETINPYIISLKTDFQDKIVTVKDSFETEYKGKIIAINFQHLNLILDSGDEIILIKNPQVVRRKVN